MRHHSNREETPPTEEVDETSFFAEPQPPRADTDGEEAYKRGDKDWGGLSEADLAAFPIE